MYFESIIVFPPPINQTTLVGGLKQEWKKRKAERKMKGMGVVR